MVQVSYPGVYVQEIPSGSRTITGVATSIAAFVGMAKSGVVGVPTLVLGFTDYSRTYSNDISQGEMTDQVRQFFLNQGQQAYIVRIGQGIVSASTVLTAPSGATLTLTAASGGELGNNLRAIVDYNTSSPERTFNLTVFRELTDASGNTTSANQEIHKDLSMDKASPRFVETVLAQNSALVTGLVANNTPAATAFSASAAQATDIIAAIVASIPTGGQGKFKISLGGGPFRTISIPKTGVANAADLQALINTQALLPPNTVTVTTPAAGTLQFLQLSSASDVLLDRAADSDIALRFGLGTVQGGVEVGLFSANRPRPSGLVSEIGANLAQLQVFAASAKAAWAGTSLKLVGGGIDLGTVAAGIPGDHVVFPDLTALDMRDTSTAGGLASLVNVRACLNAIASTITNESPGWRAEVDGYRLALRPKNGPATAGAGASFDATVAPPGFVATSIFAAVVSGPAAADLENGDDGSKPAPGDYLNAYTALDKVDLFNLLVLPRSTGDANDREAVWGPASSFAASRRAFLIMDLDTTVQSVSNGPNSAAAAVVRLRNGLVKDHSGLYWPRVRINPDGNSRLVDASGTVAGIMARIDSTRGVWKAPAGIEADLRGVLAVDVPLTDQENGVLNPLALNAVRSFTNGIVSWGARTMDGFDNSGDDDFKYVPVRRLESFIEESLLRGLKFAVFEPNDEPLWAQIRLSAGAFMNNLFRQGAFAGQSTRDAYFVKVDSETTTQNDINLGIVNVVVGFAPLKPAEFVVISIQQLAGQVQV